MSTSSVPAPFSEAELRLLQALVYQECGMHFDERRSHFLQDRLQRRLKECQLDSFYSYYRLLISREGKDELSRLLENLTVNETSFFRNKSQLEFFHKHILEELFRRKQSHRDYSLRIWSAGCSTGEEVYSLAILLQEEGVYERARIYATDINESVLDRARSGVFPLEKMQEYTQNYIRAGGTRAFSEYYVAAYDGAQFQRSLIENVVFAQHNLVSDRSFNEFNVIVCRNVMIYFDKQLQNRVHELFYESLAHFGVLALGHKESIHFSPHADEYDELDANEKLYRKVR